MKPEDMRENYERMTLNREDLSIDAMKQFSAWFDQAVECPEVHEANAMTLATVDSHGQVHQRVVLLKQFDDRGLVFYSNYDSDKAKQIETNPLGALHFYWPGLERQLRIEGSIEKTTREESVAYFNQRPRGSQIGAWASEQSKVIHGRHVLEEEQAELEKRFDGYEVPCPDHWGGYRLNPTMLEFWQGRPSRLHDRFRYRWARDQWIIERLSP